MFRPRAHPRQQGLRPSSITGSGLAIPTSPEGSSTTTGIETFRELVRLLGSYARPRAHPRQQGLRPESAVQDLTHMTNARGLIHDNRD